MVVYALHLAPADPLRLLQLNTSRDTIAYNVIDLDDFPKDSTENLQKELLAMDGVLSTRFIFTGSVAEGPAAFYVKDVSVCG